jgi:hypothetical protein
MCLIQTEVGRNLSDLANPHLFRVGLPDLEFIVAAIQRRTFGIMPSLPAQYYGELGQVTDVAPTTANPPVAPAAQSDTSERRAGVSVIASDSEIVPARHTRMTESGKTIQALKALGVQARPPQVTESPRCASLSISVVLVSTIAETRRLIVSCRLGKQRPWMTLLKSICESLHRGSLNPSYRLGHQNHKILSTRPRAACLIQPPFGLSRSAHRRTKICHHHHQNARTTHSPYHHPLRPPSIRRSHPKTV